MKLKVTLTGNALKLIAAAAMLCDHIAMIFLRTTQYYTIMRSVGRIAFPIFAFFIAEGCFYTKNRLKYVLTMLAVGVPCQLIEYIAAGELKLNIMFTLAMGALIVFAYDCMSAHGRGSVDGTTVGDASVAPSGPRFSNARMLGVALFGSALVICAAIAVFPGYQYGFFGALLPLSAYIMRRSKLRLLPFALTLVLVSLSYAPMQLFSLAALPLLILYDGNRGKYNLKYFFYIFYPSHLLVLWGLYYLIRI